MATLGHVTSTALTGGDSPVFEKAGVEAVIEFGIKQDAVQVQLNAQSAQINDLTASLTALTALLTAQAAQPKPVEPAEPVELTPQEKANATKATKKAEADVAAKSVE